MVFVYFPQGNDDDSLWLVSHYKAMGDSEQGVFLSSDL